MYLQVVKCIQWGGRSPGFVSSFQLGAGNCLQKPSTKPWLKVGFSLYSKLACVVCTEGVPHLGVESQNTTPYVSIP